MTHKTASMAVREERVHQPGIDGTNNAIPARPSLVINPRQDSAFVEAAETLLDAGERSLVGLQLSLRGRYPEAVVRPRDLSGEPHAVWYLFRDGHWIGGRDNGNGAKDG